MLEPRALHQAFRARDVRFDGRVFVGVTTTGIYCRPVCPAPPAKLQNCRFFPSAAAAQEAGFRPCLRCRPETAPEGGSWHGSANTVARALALVAEGAFDAEGTSLEDVAERLGVGARQLRRLFRTHLGASPISVVQTRRVLFAKHLLHETRLSMTEVAVASGFGSVRRFNEVFRDLYGRPPSELRRTVGPGAAKGSGGGVTVRLRYRPPYDWDAVLAHLAARAVTGVERVVDGGYARTVVEGDTAGTVHVTHAPRLQSVVVTLRVTGVAALPAIIARIRRVFDLRADVGAIAKHLASDPWLKPLVRGRPGLRVPGGWDGFELGVRAILGQQVTLEAGRKLAEKLVALCGVRATEGDPGLTLVFPAAVHVEAADLRSLGMPAARRETLRALARAAIEDPNLFRARATVEETVARLRAVPGIGDWTAQYIALRAAHEPDALPSSDVALVRSASRRAGRRVEPAKLLARAEAWRPWRGYAAQHLWAADAAPRTDPGGTS
ncbi:MAG TPA: AlkA N-terminal domain-containing protein [Polyangiaceae bacterium]